MISPSPFLTLLSPPLCSHPLYSPIPSPLLPLFSYPPSHPPSSPPPLPLCSQVLPKLPSVERLELIDAVLEISMYHAPSSVVVPDDYTPPKLGVSKLYWKVGVKVM